MVNCNDDGCDAVGCKYSDQLVRLRKIEGQVKGIQKMIVGERYCIDILIQLKSIKNALARVEENILRCHIETCVTEAVRNGIEGEKVQKVDELMEVISRLV